MMHLLKRLEMKPSGMGDNFRLPMQDDIQGINENINYDHIM